MPDKPTAAPPLEGSSVDDRGWAGTFHALRYRNYRILWITTLMVAGGVWFQQVTLGWLAYSMTESPLQVGAVLGTRSAPLMLAPLTGVLVDRVDRRKLLLANQTGVTALVFGFSAILFLGLEQVWHLYTFAALFGLLWAVNNPVRQTLVANSVPRSALMNATALNSVAFNSMRTVGPMIGGIVIALVGPALNFLIQGILFGMVVVMLIPYRVEYGGNAGAARHSSAAGNLAEGFRYIASHRQTLMVIGITFVMTVTMLGMVFTMLPVFVPEVLGDEDGDVLGYMLTMLGVGGLLGTMTIARFSHFERKGIQTLVAFAGAAVAVIALSQTSSIIFAAFWLAVYQYFGQAVLTTNMTMVQGMTPDRLRGRVVGVYQMEIGLMPVGGLIAGLIASSYGVGTAFLVSGVAALVFTALIGAFSPTVRKLKL